MYRRQRPNERADQPVVTLAAHVNLEAALRELSRRAHRAGTVKPKRERFIKRRRGR